MKYVYAVGQQHSLTAGIGTLEARAISDLRVERHPPLPRVPYF